MAIREIKDNPATLSPERKNIAPKKVYQSNLFMSAAYAGFWAKRYSDPSLLPVLQSRSLRLFTIPSHHLALLT
jgi:hypothetical protein